MKLWDNVEDLSYFPITLPNYLWHVSFRRHLPLSLEVVEKPNKVKFYGLPIFWKRRPRLFLGRLLARFTVRRLAKFSWVTIADLRLRSLALKYGGFCSPICRGRVYPRIRTYIFKSHLLPSMWPILVEFRSASSEGKWRKKKKEESP